MKIGYLLQEGVPNIRDKTPSGAANHVIQVIKELQNAGHEVVILAKMNQKIWRSNDLENFSPITLNSLNNRIFLLVEKAIRRLQNDLKLPYANFFESLRFSLACQQELSDCDVYFERMGWMGYGAGLAAKRLNIPLILEINGDHLDEFQIQGLSISKGQLQLSKWIMEKASQRVSHAVATGEGWKQKFIRRWGVNANKVTVVENGSNLVDILQREDLKVFSADSISNDPIKIAYCGGLEPWHGISILIAAIRQLVDRGINLHVSLIGTGSMLEDIKNSITKFDLNPYFTLTGHVTLQELSHLLSKSDIGVSPYCGRVEFSGLKLLDYKAAGLATIASGEHGQPAVLEHGKTGWIVPPCDEETLAKALEQLSKNHNLRRSIGSAARIEAEAIHSWKHTAEQLIRIFEHTLESSN